MYRTYHPKLDRTIAVLEPGEYYASDSGEVLFTLLGSCVAACIFDEEKRIGGMNHFMLPGVINPKNMLLSQVGRYGMFAMELVIGELVKLGSDRKRLKAKIFGGSDILHFDVSPESIPRANIDFARRFLELEGIPLLAQDVGGNRGRRILFFTDTSKVLVQPIDSAGAMDPLREAEEKYRNRVRKMKMVTP